MTDKQLYALCLAYGLNNDYYFEQIQPEIFVLKCPREQLVQVLERISTEKISIGRLNIAIGALIVAIIGLIITLVRIFIN